MISLLWRSVIGGLCGALLGLAALAFSYSRNPAITLEMDRGASGIVSGLYDTERVGRETFAWTRRTATMTLSELDRSVDWSCTIRLRGGRADESTLPQVVISVDGVIAKTTQTTNEYQDVAIALPARTRSSRASVTLTASTTFIPGPADPRTLGVMIDRWACAPVSAGFVRPPRPVMLAAAAGGAAFGAAFAFIGAGVLATIGAAGLLAIAQAIPLGWEFGMFTPYPERAVWLALWIAALLVTSVRAAERATGRRVSGAARLVAASTAAVMYLKLLALLHPSKPIVDAVFHAHRLQWVLDGRYYFTQPMPSGVQFPYAIGLYVFSAPWSLVTHDYVLLLRIVVTAAEAVGAVLVYRLVSRIWQDRLAGALAAILFHLVPRTFEIVGNANMTNAFGQSVAWMALAAAVLWPLQARNWLQVSALTVITAWALLSHISTFTSLSAILVGLAALYWWRGGPELRRPALAILGAVVVAALLSVAVYYAHFGDAYRSAARVRASPAASATERAEPVTVALPSKVEDAFRLTVAAVGWPIFLLAAVGVVPLWRRGFRDRLTLATGALMLTYAVFVASVVLTPVERSFQRYAAEFISRVTLATYPAMVILAGAGAAWGWRAGWTARLAAGGLMLAAGYVAAATWVEWLR
ncbi:MAG TPA: hypothetical protein VJ813_05530 [Vicinamibacterales bacterium]|nr:hypothetical protein [Vicinamibacterales bacterium]